jgi:hypothetical protein
MLTVIATDSRLKGTKDPALKKISSRSPTHDKASRVQ